MDQSSLTSAFELTDVVKTYGATRALDGITLRAPVGEIYALLGPNGSGKTTIVKVLSTLVRPDSGVAKVAGFDVVKEPARVRDVIGMAGQFAAVDEFQTGYENILMVGELYGLSRHEARLRTTELLERLDLSDAGARPVSTYSGGMRRRLDLGASLVGRPGSLFLDEPTTGLDPKSRNDVWEIIRDLVADGTSILLTTQYLDEADELADTIAVVDHGRLIASGTSDQLKSALGGDIIEFTLTAPDDSAKAIAVVVPSPARSPLYDETIGTISVPVREGAHDLMAVVQALNDHAIQVKDLSLHRPSLDDVFLALTAPPSESSRRFATAGPSSAVKAKALHDTWVITKRNMRRYVRLPQLLFFSSIQPVMFLLLFNYVFGGAIGLSVTVPGGRYIDYLLPGILIQMVMFGGVQTGIGLADDMSKGIIDRFRSLPMSRLAVVAGRTISDALRNLVVIVIMVAVGTAIGFRFQNGAVPALGMVCIAVLFGFAISWIFALIGMAVKDAETAQLASFVFIFPLTFASSAFVAVSTMPAWLQVFARNQPVTLVVDASRQLALGTPADGAVWKVLVWTAAILAVFIPLALIQYRRRAS